MDNCDPIENDPKYKDILRKVDQEVKAKLGEPGYMGYCHGYWDLKKKILLDRYGIDWKSPAELNPNVKYD